MNKKIVENKERYIGQMFETKRCGVCTVIDYRGSKDVLVKFEDPECVVKTQLGHLKIGNVFNPTKPSVHNLGFIGIGRYDSYNHMGYSNVYALMLNEIEKVSENFVPEKEIAKLTVSVSVEDKEEIAKDILKIVLQDLYVIIADAIDSLELNNTESSSVQTDTNIVTEDSVLTNLLNLIEKATADGDLESLLNLTTAYQRMKNASTI